MMRLPQRIGYWSAGLALVLVAAMLGISGHGLPALGIHMLNGEAWLSNTANRSISLIDGFSGKVGTQVGVPKSMTGSLQVVNAPGGAVVTDQHGHIVKVSNASFAATSPITLFGGSEATAAAGQSALYAVDEKTGMIQQLSTSGPQLQPEGQAVLMKRSIASPVVAPDGSLYFAIPSIGEVGHVVQDAAVTIKGAGRPGDQLKVVLAGTTPVAADLSAGTAVRLGSMDLIGHATALPAGFRSGQVTGSDIDNGLVAVVTASAVATVNVISGATTRTSLTAQVPASQVAMEGRNVVLISKASSTVVVVRTPTHSVLHLPMPHGQVPDGLTVRDRLVFVNNSNGDAALVISGTRPRDVTKYTGPPPQQHTRAPTRSSRSPGHLAHPKPPGAPQNPVATPGNAAVAVGWQPAPANGSAIIAYTVSWTGSDGSNGQRTVGGTTLGTNVTSLSNGVHYTFNVTAANQLGQGPAAQTATVTPSSSIPGVPTGVFATARTANASVTLRWTAADHGYHIASYTIWEVGTAVPVRQRMTGTVATLSSGLTPGTPVAFQIQAVGTSGASGPKSAPSAQVTPFLPPGQLTVSAQSAQPGTSAMLTVSCPATCSQGGQIKSYQVTLSPPAGVIPPVKAAAAGAATPVTLTGLTQNTQYTVAASATDTAGASSTTATVVSFTTFGPPAVSNVSVSPSNGTSPALAVSPTVTDTGLTPTCTVTLNGSPTPDPACGAVTLGTPQFNTPYTVTVTATNADGTASKTGSGKSGLKALVANATDAFGTCGTYPPPYCGANSSIEPTPNWKAGTGTYQSAGTQELAGCWTTGGWDYGNTPAWKSGSNVWVYMPGRGYMSILWFPNPAGVTAGLPQAGSC